MLATSAQRTIARPTTYGWRIEMKRNLAHLVGAIAIAAMTMAGGTGGAHAATPDAGIKAAASIDGVATTTRGHGVPSGKRSP